MPQRKLDEQLAQIKTMDRAGLKEWFQKLYLRPTPPKLSESVLRLAVAYRLQEQVYGSLDPAVRKALIAGVVKPMPATREGTVLIREWHGEHHTVTVLDKSVAYKGKQYSSLSAVARSITGNSISGPIFFGIKKTKAHVPSH